ncbi:hypothetical protein GO497_02485 [Acidovorax citrulli]|nr:hypothetical protein [Paracidovorax citrulli]
MNSEHRSPIEATTILTRGRGLEFGEQPGQEAPEAPEPVRGGLRIMQTNVAALCMHGGGNVRAALRIEPEAWLGAPQRLHGGFLGIDTSGKRGAGEFGHGTVKKALHAFLCRPMGRAMHLY